MVDISNLTSVGLTIISILIVILVFYIIYLFFTKAFQYMGFSSIEAVIIVFISFIFGFDIIILGFNISNIYLFSYENWIVSINVGGAVIPIVLSIYLIFKKKISWKNVLLGIIIVSIIAFIVTNPSPYKGIVASFPYWLLPAFFASIISVILSWKNFRKAAPLAYISGTIGVLIGADFLHLPELLNYQIDKSINAIIGGADVFDMIFLTGVIAVVLDGFIMFHQRRKEGIN